MTQLRVLRTHTIEIVQPARGSSPAIGRPVTKEVLQYRPFRIETVLGGPPYLVYSDEWVDVPIVEET